MHAISGAGYNYVPTAISAVGMTPSIPLPLPTVGNSTCHPQTLQQLNRLLMQYTRQDMMLESLYSHCPPQLGNFHYYVRLDSGYRQLMNYALACMETHQVPQFLPSVYSAAHDRIDYADHDQSKYADRPRMNYAEHERGLFLDVMA
jgi:hypothetical protein